MAKANLPVNFKDDILKENMNGKRRFNMIQNSDGTVSFEDVTDYTQVGSTFGAAQINATNTAVNNAADASKIIDSLETIKANTQSGYIAGALAVKELNSNLGNKKYIIKDGVIQSGYSIILDNVTAQLDSTNKRLLIKKSNTKYNGWCAFSIDMTYIKKVCVITEPYKPNNLWSTFVVIQIVDSLKKNSETIFGNGVSSNQLPSNGCIITTTITGAKNILVSAYGIDNIDQYSFYIHDLWFEN